MNWLRSLDGKGKAALLLVVFAVVALVFVLVSSQREEVYVQPPEVVQPEDKEPDKNLAKPGSGGGRLGGVLVSPSSQEVVNVRVGSKIDPVRIENNSNVRVGVRVDYVPMRGNSLAGAPEYDVTEETIKQGQKEIRPDIKEFILLPGAEKEVGATIVGEPQKGRGLYGLLVFRTDSLRKNKTSEEFKGGVRLQVNQTYSIGAIVIARFAGEVRESVRLEQVRVVQQDDGSFQTQVRARNEGDYIARPDGNVLLSRNSDGQVVEDVPLVARQGIFPGDNRDLIGEAGDLRLPEGDYTATARLEGQETAWAFRVDSEGNIPVSEGVFEVVPEPGRPRPDQDFNVLVQMQNTGEVELEAAGEVLLYRFGVDEVLQKTALSLGPIGSGDIASETVPFQGLPEEGNYEIVLELETRDGISLGQKAGNLIVDDREAPSVGLYDRIRDWMSANPLLTLLLGAALLSLVFGGVLFLTRKRS